MTVCVNHPELLNYNSWFINELRHQVVLQNIEGETALMMIFNSKKESEVNYDSNNF